MKSHRNTLTSVLRHVSRARGISLNETSVCAALLTGVRGADQLARSTGLSDAAVGSAVRGLKNKGILTYTIRRGDARYSEVVFLD